MKDGYFGTDFTVGINQILPQRHSSFLAWGYGTDLICLKSHQNSFQTPSFSYSFNENMLLSLQAPSFSRHLQLSCLVRGCPNPDTTFSYFIFFISRKAGKELAQLSSFCALDVLLLSCTKGLCLWWRILVFIWTMFISTLPVFSLAYTSSSCFSLVYRHFSFRLDQDDSELMMSDIQEKRVNWLIKARVFPKSIEEGYPYPWDTVNKSQ